MTSLSSLALSLTLKRQDRSVEDGRPVWEVEDADWREYESLYDDEDDAYERWREERTSHRRIRLSLDVHTHLKIFKGRGYGLW